MVPIPDIVSFSANMVKSVARDANVACHAVVEPDLPAFRGDAKLQQILINLLAAR